METSAMRFSRLKGKKNPSKLSKYETNMENYMMGEQFSL